LYFFPFKTTFLLKIKYPFDASILHHVYIALSLALWIFVFLYFTEPLNVSEISTIEKLAYLPFYGIAGGLAYLIMLPFQQWLFKIGQRSWTLQSEFFFLLFFMMMGLVLSRSVYVFIIVPNEPNIYSLAYFITGIYLPTLIAVIPIVFISRWAIGKYKNKRLEDKKIVINGEGTYEGLRLLQENLISIKSDDNYIEVTYLVNEVLKKQLIRNKLSVIEKDLAFVVRTHRSYLINPVHFQRWDVSNGKLQIMLAAQVKIPVSKTYASHVKSTIKDLGVEV
jgi:hypothetical protein